jgi:DnaK suppressor protein
MGIQNTQKFREQLTSRLQELDGFLQSIKVEINEANESQTNFLRDVLDHAKELADTTARIELHGKYQRERQAVLRALDRMAFGLYGDCIECADSIGDRRLTVQPHAILCVDCQHKKERDSRSALSVMQRLNLRGLIPFFFPLEVA